MNVLQVVHDFGHSGPGGTQSHVQRLIGHQVNDGFRVAVFSSSRERRIPASLAGEIVGGVPVYRLHRSELYHDAWDKSASPEANAVFLEVLDEAKPDIVHVHHGIGISRHLVRLARGQGLPVVWTLHDFWSTCPRVFRVKADESFCDEPPHPGICSPCVPRRSWQTDAELDASTALYRDDFREEVRAASALIALTRTHRDALARYLDIPAERILVIPNGYDRRCEEPTARPAPADPFRIVTWSLLSPIKGVHLLIDAFRELVASRPHAELVILGGAENEEYGRALRAQADGLNVHFRGPFQFDDLTELTPDIAVLPTLAFESYSYLVDEALDLGWPMIVSDLGPLAERAGAAAVSFRRGDAQDLAQRLGELYDDRERLETLRSAARPEAFGTQENARQITEVYRAVRETLGQEPSRIDVAAQWRLAVAQRETAQEWCLAHEGDALRIADVEDQLQGQREEDQRKGSHIHYLEGRLRAQADKIAELEKQLEARRLEIDRHKGHVDFLEGRVADLEVAPLPRREALDEPEDESPRHWLERTLRRLGAFLGGSRPR
ncbi:MAG: glycosyltransferase [Planctomycetota bacterium]